MNASLLSGNNKEAVGSLFYTGFYRKKKKLCDFYFSFPKMPRTNFYFIFRVRLVEKRGNASGLICLFSGHGSDFKTRQSVGFVILGNPG